MVRFGAAFGIFCLIVAAVFLAVDSLPNEPGLVAVMGYSLPLPSSFHAEFYGPGFANALDYLQDRGFYLDAEMQWHVPFEFVLTDKDFRALAFLAAEWGYSAGFIRDAEVIPPRYRMH